MMSSKRTWTLEDHLCRACGGRVLKCATGAGMTPGGNPLWKCADCGRSSSGMDASCLCWCGFSHKHNHPRTAYRCLPFELINSRPELIPMFKACGCDPARGGEVGIVLEKDLRAPRPDK